jgi:mercuric ion transport protein
LRVVARGSRLHRSAAVSGVSSALIAFVGCPACWPAYVGFLSSLGLSVLTETAVFVPITLGLLGVALGALAYRPDRRRGLRPFGLGVLGAAVVLYGRFAAASDSVVLAGAGLLISASIWNGWPHLTTACEGCEPTEK